MRYFACMLFLVLISGCVREKPKEKITTNIRNAALVFEELDLVLKKEGGKLWNHSLSGPLMLVDRQSRIIYANEADEAGYLKEHNGIYTGILPENQNIANTSFSWNGKKWIMVALPLPQNEQDKLSLLIHESFHRIQPEIGFDSIMQQGNAHLDEKTGRVYLKMELEALRKALQSEEPHEQIINALAFRSYRHKLFPGAKESENSLEIHEGLAEYTGSILSGRKNEQLKQHYINMIERFYESPTFVRSFAYYTIPVYGYFMQRENSEWNLDINKKTNLSDYIYHFYNYNNASIDEQMIKNTGEAYMLDSIIALEEQREIQRQAQLQDYRKRFLSDSVFVLHLQQMSIAFNPSNLMPLDSFGTVYPIIRVTDNWGILEVDSGGALLSPQWDKVKLDYPVFISDSIVKGNGWTLKPNNGWIVLSHNNELTLVNSEE